jgi:fructose-bisphosphate aldolase class II
MTLVSLTDVLRPALVGRTAVAGLVVLGWEDALAFVAAAEAEGAPVILQAGPGCRAHTPLPVLGAMFRTLGEQASVPVVAHLDHGQTAEECARAIDAGFTSVMFDGSMLPLDENIARTAEIAAFAHAAGVSVEAELGYVGTVGGRASRSTDPGEAARFAAESGADALAIAIGNLHLQQGPDAVIDWPALRTIEATCPGLPLVLHGGSGIPLADRRALAVTQVCKFNIGTELRMAFGSALRQAVNRDPARFDRIAILSETIPPLTDAARAAIRSCRGAG